MVGKHAQLLSTNSARNTVPCCQRITVEWQGDHEENPTSSPTPRGRDGSGGGTSKMNGIHRGDPLTETVVREYMGKTDHPHLLSFWCGHVHTYGLLVAIAAPKISCRQSGILHARLCIALLVTSGSASSSHLPHYGGIVGSNTHPFPT